MLDALSTEVLLSLATVGVSGLAICGMVIALKATQPKKVSVDVERMVKNAPYHRLHNIVRPRGY